MVSAPLKDLKKEIVELSNKQLRRRLKKNGFTKDEIEAWDQVRRAAVAVLKLPGQHAMEKEEACHAFHQIQNYLLSRSAMRGVLGY